MYHEDSKSFLLFGQQLNQIIAILQMVSDKNPKDMLNGFIFGDQETIPDEIRPIGQRDTMTLEEMMDDLQLKFMDKRNGKN